MEIFKNKDNLYCNQEMVIRMKVLLACSDGKINGASLCLAALAERLIEENRCEILVSLPEYGEFEKVLKEKNIRYVVMRQYGWSFSVNERNDCIANCKRQVYFSLKTILNQKNIVAFVKLLKTESIDLVVQNSLTCYTPAAAAYRIGIPYIWHMREFMEEGLGFKFWNPFYVRKMLYQAKALIAVSSAIREYYDRYFDFSDRITVIYDGIDQSEYMDCKDRTILVNDLVRMVYAGRFVRNKGCMELLEAVRRLRDSGFTEFQLDLYGNGELEKEMKSFVRVQGLDSMCFFHPFVSDIASVWKNADIAFSCAYAEAFGRVTVEAMMSGSFVIGTKGGATPELLKNGKYGAVVDLNSLDKAVEYVLNNKKIVQNVAKSAQRYALKEYTLDQTLKKTWSIYQKAMER